VAIVVIAHVVVCRLDRRNGRPVGRYTCIYVYLFGKGGGQRGGKSGRRQMPHGAFVWPSVGAVMVADTCVYIDTDTHALGI